MKLLMQIHSDLRWLIVIVAAAGLVRFLAGWLGNGSFKKIDRVLGAAFAGLIDLQAMLGLVFLFWNGLVDGAGFPRHRLEHTAAMIAAMVLAHMGNRWKKAADRIRFRNSFLTILGVLVLIYLGVASLPGGWTR
jgi:hypothetical protein